MLSKLMEKRYECIMSYGSFTVGQVIEPIEQHEKVFASHPESFKELKWYEKRNINESWSREESKELKWYQPIIQRQETIIQPVVQIKNEEPIVQPVIQPQRHIFRENENYHKKNRIIECYMDGSYSRPKFKPTDRTDKIALFRIYFKPTKKSMKKPQE